MVSLGELCQEFPRTELPDRSLSLRGGSEELAGRRGEKEGHRLQGFSTS